MSNVLLYFLFVGFITKYIQTQKIFGYIFRGEMLSEMRECGFCLGFWIALIGYAIFLPDGGIIDFLPRAMFSVIIDSFVTASVVSWTVQYIIKGWKQDHTIQYVK